MIKEKYFFFDKILGNIYLFVRHANTNIKKIKAIFYILFYLDF